jgi:DNA-binding response OmpR family regulator
MRNRITIIEDDKDLLKLTTMALMAAGYDVTSKSDGMNLLSERNEIADMYIIDINLGNENGLDLCRKLRKEVVIEDKPIIIMISAHPDLKALALDAAADDALPKPFNSKTLLRKIEEYLPHRIG